jgi:hypothetical protein
MAVATRADFDFLDKICLAASSRTHGLTNAPTWEWQVEGRIEVPWLREALSQLVEFYPWCAARVIALDGPPDRAARFAWDWSSPAIAQLLEVEDLTQATEAEAAARVDALRRAVQDRFIDLFEQPPLLLVAAFMPGSRMHLFVKQHHGLADGRAMIELHGVLAELLRRAESAALGAPYREQPLSPSPRRREIDALGLGRWQRLRFGVAGLMAYLRAIRAGARRPVTELRQNRSLDYSGGNRTLHLDLPAERLARLKQASRRLGFNLNAALIGSLFEANRRWNAEAGIEVGRVTMTVIADTRPRDGSFASFANHLCSLIPDLDLSTLPGVVEIAAESHRQLLEQVQRRVHLERYVFERWLIAGFRMHDLRRLLFESKHTAFNLNFSNVLSMPIEELAGLGWRVERIRISTPTTPRTAVVLTATTYRDASTLNLNYKDSIVSAGEVARLADHLVAALDDLERAAGALPPDAGAAAGSMTPRTT